MYIISIALHVFNDFKSAQHNGGSHNTNYSTSRILTTLADMHEETTTSNPHIHRLATLFLPWAVHLHYAWLATCKYDHASCLQLSQVVRYDSFPLQVRRLPATHTRRDSTPPRQRITARRGTSHLDFSTTFVEHPGTPVSALQARFAPQDQVDSAIALRPVVQRTSHQHMRAAAAPAHRSPRPLLKHSSTASTSSTRAARGPHETCLVPDQQPRHSALSTEHTPR